MDRVNQSETRTQSYATGLSCWTCGRAYEPSKTRLICDCGAPLEQQYDIERMVKEMQNAVSAGVMEMDKFADQVRGGAREIADVSGRLGDIIGAVQAISGRFGQVTEGMRAQSQGAEQIREAMVRLADGAESFERAIVELLLDPSERRRLEDGRVDGGDADHRAERPVPGAGAEQRAQAVLHARAVCVGPGPFGR